MALPFDFEVRDRRIQAFADDVVSQARHYVAAMVSGRYADIATARSDLMRAVGAYERELGDEKS